MEARHHRSPEEKENYSTRAQLSAQCLAFVSPTTTAHEQLHRQVDGEPQAGHKDVEDNKVEMAGILRVKDCLH